MNLQGEVSIKKFTILTMHKTCTKVQNVLHITNKICKNNNEKFKCRKRKRKGGDVH